GGEAGGATPSPGRRRLAGLEHGVGGSATDVGQSPGEAGLLLRRGRRGDLLYAVHRVSRSVSDSGGTVSVELVERVGRGGRIGAGAVSGAVLLRAVLLRAV